MSKVTIKNLGLLVGAFAAVSLAACNSSDNSSAPASSGVVSAAAATPAAAAPAPGTALYTFSIQSLDWSLNGAAAVSTAPDVSMFPVLASDAAWFQTITSAVQTQEGNVELYASGVLVAVINLPADGSAPVISYSANSIAVDSLAYAFTAAANSQALASAVLTFNVSQCIDEQQSSSGDDQQGKGKGGTVQACDTLAVAFNLQEVASKGTGQDQQSGGGDQQKK